MHHLLLSLNIGDSLLAGPRIQEPCLKYRLLREFLPEVSCTHYLNSSALTKCLVIEMVAYRSMYLHKKDFN